MIAIYHNVAYFNENVLPSCSGFPKHVEFSKLGALKPFNFKIWISRQPRKAKIMYSPPVVTVQAEIFLIGVKTDKLFPKSKFQHNTLTDYD